MRGAHLLRFLLERGVAHLVRVRVNPSPHPEPRYPILARRLRKRIPGPLSEGRIPRYRRFNASNSSIVRGQSDPSSRDRLRSASTFPPV